jgi:hypothetical protein
MQILQISIPIAGRVEFRLVVNPNISQMTPYSLVDRGEVTVKPAAPVSKAEDGDTLLRLPQKRWYIST